MPSVEILNSHPLSYLRKMIAESNEKLGVIVGYSKGMKKAQIIEHMMKHKDRFHHIEMYKKPVRVKAEPKAKAEPKKEKSATQLAADIRRADRKKAKAVPKKEKLTVTKADGTKIEIKMKAKK
jgi:hypothetical protein